MGQYDTLVLLEFATVDNTLNKSSTASCFRYPRELVSARCNTACTKCTSVDSSDFGCFPVHYTVKVLRKTDTCVNGVFVYEAAYQKIGVGCTCARVPTGANPV